LLALHEANNAFEDVSWCMLVLCHGHILSCALLQVMNLIGDVRGKVAVMMDDMIDTAGNFSRDNS
jgi:phosphoribosylpyrophosphate synthetase